MACIHSSVGRMSSQSTHASRPRLFRASSKRRTTSVSLRDYEMKTSYGRGTCWSPGAAGIGCYFKYERVRYSLSLYSDPVKPGQSQASLSSLDGLIMDCIHSVFSFDNKASTRWTRKWKASPVS